VQSARGAASLQGRGTRRSRGAAREGGGESLIKSLMLHPCHGSVLLGCLEEEERGIIKEWSGNKDFAGLLSCFRLLASIFSPPPPPIR